MLKRGVSPLIATVLIIGFTVALGAVIVLWGQGFIKEMQHESTLKEEKASRCIATSISITNPEQTKPNEATFILENLGSYPVDSIIIRVTGDKGADSATQPGMSVGEKKARTISFDATKVGIVKELEVVPTLDIEGEVTPCTPGMKTELELPESTAEQWAIFCGDGNINDWEECDSTAPDPLNGQTCQSLGFESGGLACTDCAFDTSGCATPPDCGNKELDDGEACDNDELGMGIFPIGTSCVSEGFVGGTLLCTRQCALDSSLCEKAAPEGVPNLMAWWKMENDLGDSSGNNIFASCGAGSCPAYKPDGAVGGAYDFDGTDDYSESIATSGRSTNTFTITAWVKPRAAPQNAYDGIIVSRDGVTQGMLVSDIGANQLGYIWENSGEEFGSNTGLTFTAGQWQFIALVIEPTKATLYLNDKTWTNTKTHNPKRMDVKWTLGQDSAAGGRFWNGGIDEVMIWNRSLSAQEINARYTS